MLQKSNLTGADTTSINKALTKEKGWKYFLLSLGAFFGMCTEFIHVYGWETPVFGGPITYDNEAWQLILHLVVVPLTWVPIAFLLIRTAKNKLGFEVFIKGEKMKLWGIIVVILLIVFSCGTKWLASGEFKPVSEFKYHGALLFTFQYIYYIVETLMFLLIIVFGQKAFDLWTNKRKVPWGGLICGFTFGAIHLISNGQFDLARGIIAIILGILFGVAYLVVNRDFWKAYVVLFLLFVL